MLFFRQLKEQQDEIVAQREALQRDQQRVHEAELQAEKRLRELQAELRRAAAQESARETERLLAVQHAPVRPYAPFQVPPQLQQQMQEMQQNQQPPNVGTPEDPPTPKNPDNEDEQ